MLDWVWSFSARPRTRGRDGDPAQRSSSSACARCWRPRTSRAGTSRSLAAGGGHQGQGQHGGHARARACSGRAAHRPLHVAASGQLARTDVHRRPADRHAERSWRWPSPCAVPSTACDRRWARRRRSRWARRSASCTSPEQQVDVAVVEVGTGGRFDATNLLEPLVSVDHADQLRPHARRWATRCRMIAWHKAGILRAGRPGDPGAAVRRGAAGGRSRGQRARCAAGRSRPRMALAAARRRSGRSASSRPTPTSSRWTRASACWAITSATTPRRRSPRCTPWERSSRSPLRRATRRRCRRAWPTCDWPGRLQVLSEQPLLVARRRPQRRIGRRAARGRSTSDLSFGTACSWCSASARAKTRAACSKRWRRAHTTSLSDPLAPRAIGSAGGAAASGSGDCARCQRPSCTRRCRPLWKQSWQQPQPNDLVLVTRIAVPGRGSTGVVAQRSPR